MPGSVRELKPGVWELRVSAGKDDRGRRRYISKTLHTKDRRAGRGRAEAEKTAAVLYTKVLEGRAAPTAGTVGELFDRWLEHLEANDRAPNTLARYRSIIKVWIKPNIGHIALRKLSAQDLDALQSKMAAAGQSDLSRRKVHAAAATGLHQAVRWGLLESSPSDRATPPKVREREPTPPTVEEIQRLMQAVQNRHPDLASIIFVGATTGCRRGELCGIQFRDVDFEQRSLVVRRTVCDPGGQVSIRETTKTFKSRQIALDDATVAILEAQRARAEERCEVLGIPLTTSSFVWSKEADHRSPWKPDGVTKAFTYLRRNEGLDHVNFGHLRHFAATMMLAGGVDVRTAAGRLGHDPTLLMRRYAHVLGARDRAAADLLGKAFEEPQAIEAVSR